MMIFGIWPKAPSLAGAFTKRFFGSNRQRKTPTVIRHMLSSPRQPTTLWPKARDFIL